MNKYKVGDKFIVEIEEIYNGDLVKHEEHMHLHRIKGFNSLVLDEYGLDKLQKYDKYAENLERNHEVLKIFEEKYNKGLNDAWELARKIVLKAEMGGICYDDFKKIFGVGDYASVLRTLSPQQALAKIEAYEESKAIKVGDVVFNDREDVKAVIIDSSIAEGTWQVYTEDCCVELWKECEFKKTGKTVDIEHLLEQIRGNA